MLSLCRSPARSRSRGHSRPRRAVVAFAVVALAGPAACGDKKQRAAARPSDATTTTVHLGYFPNLTHATAIVGVEKGIFARALGANKLALQTFSAGPSAVEALFAGGLDATYIGPNPTINAWQKSNGTAVRIISGATSGGAALVVKPGIAVAADLKGKKLASPQLGGTQDVALRSWLAAHALKADLQGGGDVAVVPQENAQTLQAFKAGDIDGAWVPEPWATRLVQEGGGKVFVDERDLWPGGSFVTTQLVVRTAFLVAHPDAVKRLLQAQVEANQFVHEHEADAQQAVNQGIAKVTGKALPPALIEAAWKNLTFTNDPIASSLRTAADNAVRVGLLQPVKLKGIYDLSFLNAVLKQDGQSEVTAP